MAMTPEGKVKATVKSLFAEFGEHLYQFWPVQTGYGAPTLDCLAMLHGVGFAVETKAPGKVPTARQDRTIYEIKAAGGMAFVVDGSETSLEELRVWMYRVHNLRMALRQ